MENAVPIHMRVWVTWEMYIYDRLWVTISNICRIHMKLSEKDKYMFFKRKNIYTYKFNMQKLIAYTTELLGKELINKRDPCTKS